MNLPKPTLDRETAMKLWIEERSDCAKEQVVLNNVGLVAFSLKSLNQNIFDEDLYATGIVGLCKAINGFDESKGIKFNTYAGWVIRNEILMTFRKKRITPAFSLDEPYQLENGDLVNLSETIADNRRFEDEVIADMQMKKVLLDLNDREKKIISLSMDGKTQGEIADICGISQPYVSRIIKSIHKKWREQNETL